jgi:hypothetical protein
MDASVLDGLSPEMLGASDWYTAKFRTITRPRTTLEPRGNVTVLAADRINQGVTLDPSRHIFSPMSSGHFGISCALIMDAKRIFLLGFDCRYTLDKQAHFYDTEEVKKSRRNEEASYQRMLAGFEKFARWKDRLYNVSSISAIPEEWIKRITFDKALEL